MLDKLFSLFKNNPIQRMNSIVTYVSYIITLFEDEFQRDKDAKNAAIDTIIELLQKHKNQ